MTTEDFTAQDLMGRLAEASASIEVARRALGEGRIVSLDGLEEHVDMTCRRITALPREQGEALKPPMLALIDGLDQLSKSLAADHRQTESALNGLSDRERAQSAYTKHGKS